VLPINKKSTDGDSDGVRIVQILLQLTYLTFFLKSSDYCMYHNFLHLESQFCADRVDFCIRRAQVKVGLRLERRYRLVDQWDTCFNQQGDYV
jgi:hypothetical protein